MPHLIRLRKLSVLLLGITSIFISGCFKSKDRVPFPSGDSEFAQPVARPLKLDEPITIEWRVTDPDSIKPLPVKKFDLSKIPAKSFDIGEPLPLKVPMVEKTFDWNTLPDTVFDLSNLPTQKLRFQTILMAPPKISKAVPPVVKQGASRGVMDPGPGLGANGRCFLQDQSGALWIGTDKGLIRNDGVNLETYSEDQGLPDDIFSLEEDSNHRIWIGTSSEQVFVLDRKSGVLQRLIHTFSSGALGFTLNLMEDRDGQMWISVGRIGVLIVDPKNQTIKQFGKKEGLANNSAIRILLDRQGLVWITTRYGVTIIDSKKKSNKHLSKLNGLEGDQFFAIMEDQEGDIWLGGAGGSHLINKEKGTIKRLDKAHGMNGTVWGLYQSKSGLIWISLNSGMVFSFNKKSNDVEKFIIQKEGIFIYNLIEDQEGQIWMGSFRSGCFVINPNQGRPANFTTADGLGNNSVWATLEARDGKIWIGTRGGIDVYNPALKTIQHIGIDQGLLSDNISHLYEDRQGRIWVGSGNEGVSIVDEKAGVIKYLTPAQGLRDRGINTFYEDSDDQMWMGCSRNGEIYVYNYSRRLLKTITNLTGFKSSGIDAIKGDINGRIWVSAYPTAGIVIVDPNENKLQYLNTKQGLSNNNVNALLVDHKGNVLAGTNKGIDRINLESNTLTSIKMMNGLASDVIYTLNENKGKIYAGTSAGLSIVSEGEQGQYNVVSYGRNQGLTYVDFDQNSATFTKQNQFWAGVDNQILTVIDEPVKDTIQMATYVTGINIFDKRQTFSSTKILARQLDLIDTLWKPEPGKFYPDKKLPIDSSSQQQNGIKWDSVEYTYKMPINLQLPYDQNYLSFTFAGVHLSNPDKVRYRYMLEGIDKMWSPISENTISENYRDLPPGDYTFKVSNKGANGLWSEPAQLKFMIMPPWWQSWWAYIAYGLLFMGGVFLADRIQRKRLLEQATAEAKEKELKQAREIEKAYKELKATQSQLIQSEKMASLGELTAGIAHEIQNPLNFVNNFSEVNSELIAEMKEELTKGNLEEVKKIANDIDENEKKIIFHGKRADGIVKGMLQHSRSSSGVKEPTDINVLADEYLRLAYHGLRAKDKSFNASMKTDFDDSIGKINVLSQDLGRVILNLITNAFYAVTEKKGSVVGNYEPTVWVITKKIGDRVLISVKDNGNGIPQKVIDKIFHPFFTTKPTGQGTGLGLSISYDIVRAHGGELKVETKEGEGSEFIIQLPIL